MDVLLNAGRAMAALAAYLGAGEEARLDRAALAQFAEWWIGWRRSV
jgi:hypothetical protein